MINYFKFLGNKLKIFSWNIVNSVANYFFKLIAKDIFIDKLPTIELNELGFINKGTICNIKYSDETFRILEIDRLKFFLSLYNIIPKLHISNLTLDLTLIFKSADNQPFYLWKQHDINSIVVKELFDSLLVNLSNFLLINIDNIHLHIDNTTFLFKNVIINKNREEYYIHINNITCYFYKNILFDAKKIDLSVKNNTVSSAFINKLTFSITNNIIQNSILDFIENILSRLCLGNNTNKPAIKHPNIFIKHTIINYYITNYLSIKIDNIIYENSRLLLPNTVVKIWKKNTVWLKNIEINTITNLGNCEEIRIRLFQSTGDKLYKSFKSLWKYLHKFLDKNIEKPSLINNTNQRQIDNNIISNYFDNIKNSIYLDREYSNTFEINNNYLETVDNILYQFTIDNTIVDFYNTDSHFNFRNIDISKYTNKTSVKIGEFLFRYLNQLYLSRNLFDKNPIIIDILENGIRIIPNKLRFVLDIEAYAKIFGIFGNNIGRIIDIFIIERNRNNYIFEYVSIQSFKIEFSYLKQRIDYNNLVDGNYIELLNLLTIRNINLLLKNIECCYPKDMSALGRFILSKWVKDIIDNNFDNIISNTPLKNINDIKKFIGKLPHLAGNMYRNIFKK